MEIQHKHYPFQDISKMLQSGTDKKKVEFFKLDLGLPANGCRPRRTFIVVKTKKCGDISSYI